MLELQKQPVPEGGQALKEAKICVQVLGSRSGYIKGLGHGPRPPSSSSKSTHKSHREIELENELKATRELLQSQETRIQHQQSQIAQLASFVSEMHQHMHIPGSSSRSSSPSMIHRLWILSHTSWMMIYIFSINTWFGVFLDIIFPWHVYMVLLFTALFFFGCYHILQMCYFCGHILYMC